MAENQKGQQQGKVMEMPKRCTAEGCKNKDVRMSFCDEHFAWYKEGLITTKGKQVKDFDKKFQSFMHRKSKIA